MTADISLIPGEPASQGLTTNGRRAFHDPPVPDLSSSSQTALPPSSRSPISRPRPVPPPLPEGAASVAPERAATDAEFSDRMLERLASGDYVGALFAADALLETHPRNQDALDTAQIARSELRKLYAARFGSLDRVPHLTMGPEALFSIQTLDFRAGLLLSRVDGESSVREIAVASALPSHEALRILSELYLHRVIALRD